MNLPIRRNTKAIRIVAFLLSLLQISSLVGGYVLDDLSRRKVGVNHHVVIQKRRVLQTILRVDRIILYQILILFILGAIIAYLVRHREWPRVRVLGPLAIITLTIGLGLTVPFFKTMPAYVYLLGIGGLVWILEFVKVLLKIPALK